MEEKDKSAVEEFLGDLGDSKIPDPFENQEQSSQEETQENTDDKDGKPLPFNKDPKLQKYLDKREKEIEERLRESLKGNQTNVAPQAEDEVTDVLTRLIGNDTPEKVSMVKEFKNILEKGTQKAKTEAIAELEARQQAEVEADKQAEKELENAFESIEETYEVDISSNSPVAKKTRQDFVAFVEKIAPKDKYGDIVAYPDMTSAWETFSEMQKKTPSRAKELASRGMNRSSETPTVKDIKGLNFDNILEHLGS